MLSLPNGETTAADAARGHGLKVAEVEEWRGPFLLGAENALRARPKEGDALREGEVNRLKRKVGELTMGPGHSAGGGQATPSDAGDVGQVMATLPRRVDAQSSPASPTTANRELAAAETGTKPGDRRTATEHQSSVAVHEIVSSL